MHAPLSACMCVHECVCVRSAHSLGPNASGLISESWSGSRRSESVFHQRRTKDGTPPPHPLQLPHLSSISSLFLSPSPVLSWQSSTVIFTLSQSLVRHTRSYHLHCHHHTAPHAGKERDDRVLTLSSFILE